MKVTIEMTPEEAKEMMLPPEKVMDQLTPFQGNDLMQNMLDMQKEMYEQVMENFRVDDE